MDETNRALPKPVLALEIAIEESSAPFSGADAMFEVKSLRSNFGTRMRKRTKQLILAMLTLGSVQACADTIAPELGSRLDAETMRVLETPSVTIRHHYRIFATQRAYLQAFDSLQRLTRSRTARLATLTCGPMENLTSESLEPVSSWLVSRDSTVSRNETQAQMMGWVHVYAPGITEQTQQFIKSLSYSMPGRFVSPDFGCGGGGTVYGTNTSTHESRIMEDAVSEEEDNPPENAPPGVEQSEYDQLNPAEKRLVWSHPDWLPALRAARETAEAWAATKAPGTGHNDLQDALRHAYWQCALAKSIGLEGARMWGDAHEKYALNADEARMDLHNNRAGRAISTAYASCEEGILYARDRGWLAPAPIPAPTPTPQPGVTWTQPPPIG